MNSENAAYRVAVIWDDASGEPREGVFVARRDSGSWINCVAGGRIFPGQHHWAKFRVEDDGCRVDVSVRSRDAKMSLHVSGVASDTLPPSSCFKALEESSGFFQTGQIGYSVCRDCRRLDGMRLDTFDWHVRPFAVERVESSFFSDASIFPPGSANFDHALIMRDVPHQWHSVPDLVLGAAMPETPESASFGALEPATESA